ncbi:ATP-binding protein [Sphaerisporangium fuscum]|uniref:ATP-binding protein n=1 Tax=Sphaerisporangium fuscum TaxID=2835868 RepID=UPI001BDD45DC|nr:ATP-binding protein [Sphaerisporangium fuscum]
MRAEQPVPKEAHHRTAVLAEERRSGDAVHAACDDTFRVLVTTLRGGSASRAARAAVRRALLEAGVAADGIGDAEIIVAELAANSEKHACGPYELRIHFLSGIPMWCEMVDGGTRLAEIHAILADLHTAAEPEPSGPRAPDEIDEIDLTPFAESGRGLLLAHRLSGGHCYAYPTTMFVGRTPGKAVAFSLPAPSCGGDG